MSDISQEVITKTFLNSLHHAGHHNHPYDHWLLDHCLTEDMVDAIISLPIAPAHIDDTNGRRETNNVTRIHFGAQYRNQHAVMDTLAKTFQSQPVVDALKSVTGAPITGTSLRIEYCQDTDGFWLEPHTDIGVKKFTMLIYLNREPEGVDWGTDIYSDSNTHVGRAPSGFNTGLIFIPSDISWHGFEKRSLNGVRKSLIINYVGPEWRSRHELCFPEEAIR